MKYSISISGLVRLSLATSQLFVASCCIGQQLYVAPVGNNWGFIDKTGAVIIDDSYTSVAPFSEGMAAVSKDGSVGFIDSKGDTVITFKYEKARPFSEGLAAVQIGGKWGFIDKTGRFVIQPQLAEEPRPFDDGYSVNGPSLGSTTMKKNFFIDRKGGRTTPLGSVSLMPFHDGVGWTSTFKFDKPLMLDVWTVIDKSFRPISVELVLCNIPSVFSEGLSAFTEGPCKASSRMGYVSRDGTIAIKPTFEYAGDFKGGLATVKINGKWGFIDKTGSIKIQPQFEAENDFSEGLAAVITNGKLGFIDSVGAFAIPPSYLRGAPVDVGFKQGLAGLIFLPPNDPRLVSFIYVDRKGNIVYGPVKYVLPH